MRPNPQTNSCIRQWSTWGTTIFSLLIVSLVASRHEVQRVTFAQDSFRTFKPSQQASSLNWPEITAQGKRFFEPPWTLESDLPRLLKVADAIPASEPDISQPGPDMGDFPNSAFTLPKGRSYVEFAPVTYQTADSNNSASYNMPFMLRYGLTDDVELRLIGSGLTSVYDPGDTVVGFAPLILDTKVHLWDDRMALMIPAASLEVYVQTNWGSPEFQGGVEPSLNLNLDFPITKKTNIEMTFGYTGVQDAVRVATGAVFIPRFNHKVPVLHRENLNVNQFSYQWAIEHQLTEKLQLFLHGYYNGPVLLQSGPGSVVGVGYFYQMSKRSTIFNSYNAAVDQTAAPFSTQFGLAFAF